MRKKGQRRDLRVGPGRERKKRRGARPIPTAMKKERKPDFLRGAGAGGSLIRRGKGEKFTFLIKKRHFSKEVHCAHSKREEKFSIPRIQADPRRRGESFLHEKEKKCLDREKTRKTRRRREEGSSSPRQEKKEEHRPLLGK